MGAFSMEHVGGQPGLAALALPVLGIGGRGPREAILLDLGHAGRDAEAMAAVGFELGPNLFVALGLCGGAFGLRLGVEVLQSARRLEPQAHLFRRFAAACRHRGRVIFDHLVPTRPMLATVPILQVRPGQVTTYLSLGASPESTRNPLHVVACRPASQRPRHLLEGAARQGSLGPLHAGLQGADLEAAGVDIGRDIELSRGRERGFGGLNGEGAGVEGFGTLASGPGGILGAREGGFALRGGVRRHGGKASELSTEKKKVFPGEERGKSGRYRQPCGVGASWSEQVKIVGAFWESF